MKRGEAFARASLFVGVFLLVVTAIMLAWAFCMAGRVAAPQTSISGGSTAGDGGAGAAGAHTVIDWAYWRSVNEDVVAWVEVPGTAVSQPVVQARPADPRRYLACDVYGGWNPFGCAYVDSGCDRGVESRNVVLVGHNISFPPAMFHDLELFHDNAFARSHDVIVLHTPEGTRRYRVAGVDTVPGGEAVKRTAFSDEADFRSYVRERLLACDIVLPAAGEALTPEPCYVSKKGEGALLSLAGVRDPEEPASAAVGVTRMLTLCTCSYFENPADERTLVYAFPE